MGRFRISIGWLMVIVAVAAVDLAMVRVFFGSKSDFVQSFFFAIPMLNILGIGVLMGRRQQGRARAFWRGFTRSGCLAVAAFVLDIIANRSRALEWYFDLLDPILRSLNSFLDSIGNKFGGEESPVYWLVLVSLLVVISLPPLLIPALVGGWIGSVLSSLPREIHASESERPREVQAIE